MLPDAVLAVPRLGTINIHPSLLPKYRGAAPVQRAVIAGETETGVSIMRLVREMDAGPVFARRTRPIAPHETSAALETDLARIGAELLLEVVRDLEAGTAVEQPQDHAAATFARRLTREDGEIDWRASAPAIHNLVRGLHPLAACVRRARRRALSHSSDRGSHVRATPPAGAGHGRRGLGRPAARRHRARRYRRNTGNPTRGPAPARGHARFSRVAAGRRACVSTAPPRDHASPAGRA